jgi:GTP-binding protein
MSNTEIKTENIRNIAIIAHVDHGKTTLVDKLLKQSGIFRSNEATQERMMDSMDQERERGITIRAKNTAVFYKDYKINIVDTPGHADFGGEVERVLQMVDGVMLLVDAVEGPMPQTKFVLRKALSLGLKALVCINKIDRPHADADGVLNKVFDLFVSLNASDEQLDFPVIYASAREGFCKKEITDENGPMEIMFEFIVKHIPAPRVNINAPFQFLAITLDYDEYVGRLVIGRIFNGKVSLNDQVLLLKKEGPIKARITKLYSFLGLKRVEVPYAIAGDIMALAGLEEVEIGNTISAMIDNPESIKTVPIDEPTVAMNFYVNDSPFAGQEGTFVTSRNLRDRLLKEAHTNIALRISETDTTDCFKVSARGELSLSVLIESMRREGYELAVSKPEVIYKVENGVKLEPMETLIIDVDEQFSGVVIEKLGKRKGEMLHMESNSSGVHMEFKIPSRGIIGYRSEFLTDTKGTGVYNTLFHGFEPYKGAIPTRNTGVLVATEAGVTVAYALWYTQDRGPLIVGVGVKCYQGMVVGKNSRADDMEVNVCREKKLTNVRTKQADEAVVLIPHIKLSLEQSLSFISDDELVEITPENIRIRKFYLDPNERKRHSRAKAD